MTKEIDSEKETDVSVCVMGLSKLWGIDVRCSPLATDTQKLQKALTIAAELAKSDADAEATKEKGSDVYRRTIRGAAEFYQSITSTPPAKALYGAFFLLSCGEKINGYSDKPEPLLNGKFFYCNATKELEGLVAVMAKDVISFTFRPL